MPAGYMQLLLCGARTDMNVGYTLNEEQLHRHFSRFGNVLDGEHPRLLWTCCIIAVAIAGALMYCHMTTASALHAGSHQVMYYRVLHASLHYSQQDD